MFGQRTTMTPQSTFVARLLARDQEASEAARQTLARWKRGQFIGIEHLTDTQIEEIRAALEAEADAKHGNSTTAHGSVERLLSRY